MGVGKTKTLMIQGTGSNVGKSLLTAALCRIFLDEGYDVAPFKVQNMALNAFVTREGLEMSRAQALQAQACRLEPDVRMNPILIKPTKDSASQVIVMGKARPVLNWADYTSLKPKLIPEIRSAFSSLASEHEMIILEGAGSPAEINLMENDIVNMFAAEMADAPVLLVGDIDAGGVFASLVGTLFLLSPERASRIKGFILNKFRGERSILEPGLKKIEEISGKPVIGVVPYLNDLLLPEEDSVSYRSKQTPLFKKKSLSSEDRICRIAVVDFPRASNFTDLDPFFVEPDVEIDFLRKGGSFKALLPRPDLVILPGSKNVALDLQYLRESGIDVQLKDFAAEGGMVVGLCGGLQMLGDWIEDPHGVENEPMSVPGLGLIKMRTILEREKKLKRVEACHLMSGLTVKGFEMHHGISFADQEPVWFEESGSDQRTPLGWSEKSGRVWGSYIHGLFDSDLFRRWFIDRIREKKGWAPLGRVQAQYEVEKMIDRLAEEVRIALDLEFIYQLIR
jgi:adenosylcobyric acid synthase